MEEFLELPMLEDFPFYAWFSIMLVDRNGNARERKGNFSMLRR
jgi:hypothetical protein